MAAGTKIVIEFKNANGNTIKHTYNYGNSEVLASMIKQYGTVCINNKSAFRNQPEVLSRAYAQIISETEFDLT